MAYDQISGAWDFSYLAGNIYAADVQVFGPVFGTSVTGVQRWTKPPKVTMCFMLTVSSGGGGGGGRSGASTTARGGGGGGASGNIAKLLIPAILLPDSLSIAVPKGGLGGQSNSNGAIGNNCVISHGVGVTALGTIPNLILQPAANNQGPAGAGTTIAGGGGGTAGGLALTTTIGAAITFSMFLGLLGITGSAGGAQTGAVGADVTAVWNTIGLSPGAGGAGVNALNSGFAGGNITLQAPLDFAEGSIGPAASIVPGGAAGGAGDAGHGGSGIQLYKPFYMTGGGGGGSSDGGNGGNGGRGGIGCGGGGGGAGINGGTGGDGGDGIAIIISW